MNITITNNPAKADNDVIYSGLRAYNRQFSSGSFDPLSIYSRTNDDVIIGGLIGVSYGNWLHVHEFWVSEEHRGKSVGSRILHTAEAEAIRRNCIGVTLDTYSFQALQFYLTRGYEEFGSLSGYGNKFKRHYLQKKLD
ncbi:GNAT family N-acetyltransferase [bacterium]|nr:GNAT family N-acetyltransferase [bacterium]